jgi:cytochrome c oxidase subunit 1
LFTLHGVIMIFFFLIRRFQRRSAISSSPSCAARRNLAFPRINLLSWYLYVIGGSSWPLGAGSGTAAV